MDAVQRFLAGDAEVTPDFMAKLNGIVYDGQEAVAAFQDAFADCTLTVRGRLEKDDGLAVTCEASDGRDCAFRFTFQDGRIHRLAARWA